MKYSIKHNGNGKSEHRTFQMEEHYFKKSIQSLTKQELHNLGAKYNIRLKKSTKKDELIEKLKSKLSKINIVELIQTSREDLNLLYDKIRYFYYLNVVPTSGDLQEEELVKYRILRDDNIIIKDEKYYLYTLSGILGTKNTNDEKLRKEYPYFDIELFSATDNKKYACLKAHKKVLMAKYEYFKILFSSGFCDSDINEHYLEFDSLTLLNIIQYAYSDKCTITQPTVRGNVEMIINLIKAFDFLGCKNYENYVFEYLSPIFTAKDMDVEFCIQNKKIFEENVEVPMVKVLLEMSKRKLLVFDKDDLIKFGETQFEMNNKKRSLEDGTISEINKKRKIE